MVLYLDEITAYFEKSSDNLKSSKYLYDVGQYRNSISLSYYAMFLCAKALLLKKDFTPKTHKGVINLFGKEYVKNGLFNEKIFYDFSIAQNLRQEADYDAFITFNQDVAGKQIKLAETFYEEALKLL